MNEFHRSLEQADTLSAVHVLSDRHLKAVNLSSSGATFAVRQAPLSQPPAGAVGGRKYAAARAKLAMLVLLEVTLTVMIALAGMAYLANVS